MQISMYERKKKLKLINCTKKILFDRFQWMKSLQSNQKSMAWDCKLIKYFSRSTNVYKQWFIHRKFPIKTRIHRESNFHYIWNRYRLLFVILNQVKLEMNIEIFFQLIFLLVYLFLTISTIRVSRMDFDLKKISAFLDVQPSTPIVSSFAFLWK